MNIKKRIVNELLDLQYTSAKSGHGDYQNFYCVSFPNILDIQPLSDLIIYCNIQGPIDSPFVDGIFKIAIKIPEEYPFNMPTIKFITPIYHPNLFSKKYFSIYTETDWSPATSIRSMLVYIYSLMVNPDLKFSCNLSINYEPIETEIINNYTNNSEKWREKAAEWTKIYAAEQIWSIFNHNTFITDKERPYIIYLLWIGKQLNNRNCEGLIDPWIIYMMPYIIGQIGPTLQTKKTWSSLNDLRKNLLRI